MLTFRFRRLLMSTAAIVAAVAAVTFFAGACGSPPSTSNSSPASGSAGTATSAAYFGGMAGLVKAAQKEGTLNVIALPPDWADYGQIISSFEAKYHIKVNSAQPDGNSTDEVNAVMQLRGTNRAPDVVDLGSNVMIANVNLFTPYKVAEWNEIPANLKDPNGTWYADYAGYESIGYNPAKVPAPTSVNDLLKPAYKGMVALNGNPLQASAGFHGVVMAALANGGSASNIAPGVSFFTKLSKSGNLLPVDPTPATIVSGATPVVIDWDYNNEAAAAEAKAKGITWKTIIPANDVVAAYYEQAINKDAPHPAAARLWEEYLYSTVGQNWWLRGGAHPVLENVMIKDGTIDKAALAAQPTAIGTPVALTQDQLSAGQAYLQAHWDLSVQ